MAVSRIGHKKAYTHFIRERMKMKKVTQEDLAEHLDISQPMVSKFLRNPNALTQTYIVGTAELLGCSPGDLFRDPRKPTQEQIVKGLTDAQIEHLARIANTFRTDGTN